MTADVFTVLLIFRILAWGLAGSPSDDYRPSSAQHSLVEEIALGRNRHPLIFNYCKFADAAPSTLSRRSERLIVGHYENNYGGAAPTSKSGGSVRIITPFLIVVLVALSTVLSAQAQPGNSCKQCSDQRRACMSGYSGKTCQTEYDRCMKNCQHK